MIQPTLSSTGTVLRFAPRPQAKAGGGPLVKKNDPLGFHRAAVAAAEKVLSRARDAMSDAAERAGISYEGLFADSRFVMRSTAEKWREDGRRKGFLEGQQDGVLLGVRIAHAKNSPFAHLGSLAADDKAAVVERIIAAGKKARGEI
jgi:hypothetical protein